MFGNSLLVFLLNQQKSSTFATPNKRLMALRDYIPYYKRNLRVALPVVMTQLGGALVGLADSIMVGWYGTTELAAVSFANGIFFMIMVFAMGCVMGLTPLVGNAYAQNDDERVATYLHNGLLFTFILATLTCLILFAFVPFFEMMGQDPAVIIAARPYFIVRTISLFPYLFFCLAKQFLEGLGNTTIAMFITIGCNLLNVVLNYFFIYGKCGFPELGATGAGVATLIACILMPICFIVVCLVKQEYRRYIDTAKRMRSSWANLVQLSKVGFPIGLQTLLETFLFAASFIIVGWQSKEALAAHQIANQIADLAFMMSLGIGAATTIRVSHQYGKGDISAMKMAAKASIHLCLAMNVIGATVMIAGSQVIPMLFTDDTIVLPIASTLLIYAGIFQFSDGMQCVGAGMLRGIMDVKMPALYAFIAYIVLALPIGYLLMFPAGMGVEGMWIGFIVALSIAAILFHFRFHNRVRKMTQS